MPVESPKFRVGEIIQHLQLRYRGVIVEVHTTFSGSQQWYDDVALSRPPKDRPWYRVLVHDGSAETYVAERHLDHDDTTAPVRHPLIGLFFDGREGARYVCRRLLN